MVRVSELPARLLALRYGADMAWSPEIVDKKIIGCRRVVNDRLGTIDYVYEDRRPRGPKLNDGGIAGSGTSHVAFRTIPQERSTLVFQLGTATPELAVQAARMVAEDVAGIECNAGCPKHFSISGGMGVALLYDIERLESILRALVVEVGRPYRISVSVKIRLMEEQEETERLVERLCQTGVNAITIHLRTRNMRPREKAIYKRIESLAEICRRYNVPVLLNGDVAGRHDAEALIRAGMVDGAMIARAAEQNPSCFSNSSLVDALELSREYLALAERYDNPVPNTKYCLQTYLGDYRKRINMSAFSKAKSYAELSAVVGASAASINTNATPTAYSSRPTAVVV